MQICIALWKIQSRSQVSPNFVDHPQKLRFNARGMETLGLSDSSARTESRLRSLFWPSIQSGADVDYLGSQGYWVCTIVGVIALLLCLFTGQPIIGILISLFFYLGGVGVRERSAYAAAVVLLMYLMETLVSGLGVVRLLIGALLISNLRATWIASRWKPDSEEAVMPPTERHVHGQIRRSVAGLALA